MPNTGGRILATSLDCWWFGSRCPSGSASSSSSRSTRCPLGFWVAQQGSIYVFVVLIFVYVILMNRLDAEFDMDEGGDA